MHRMKYVWTIGAAAVAAIAAMGARVHAQGPSGTIQLDGSSTVFPISEAMAEEFQKANPGVRVTVGISGTGGGFKKFCPGETDINDASRPIKPKEIELAHQSGVDYIELPIAFDGLSLVVNPANTWFTTATVADLKRIWEPGSAVKKWSDLRAGLPDREIHLYGAGTDSGTFDYFTEAINGKEKACRPDYTASEDDNVLVQGVAGDKDALGFFGYAYYSENKDKLKLVSVDGGAGPVTPTVQTIENGSYKPLSRPIFLYVSTKAAARPEVQAFVKFYLTNARSIVPEVGYIPLPQEVYDLAMKRFDARKTGTAFASVKPGQSLVEILKSGN